MPGPSALQSHASSASIAEPYVAHPGLSMPETNYRRDFLEEGAVEDVTLVTWSCNIDHIEAGIDRFGPIKAQLPCCGRLSLPLHPCQCLQC